MRFRILRGYTREARDNMRVALGLALMQAPTTARAHALYTGAVLATSQGDHADATRLLGECLTLRRALKNPTEIAATLSTLAAVRLQEGDVTDAAAYEEEALGVFRQVGERIGEGISLLHLGEIAMQAGEDTQAASRIEQCLAIARDIKHQELEAECERNLGELALGRADLPSARIRFERSLNICRNAADKRNEALALQWLGKLEVMSGNADKARKLLAEALRAFAAFEMNAEVLACLEDHADLLDTAAQPRDASRLRFLTAGIRRRLGLPRARRDKAPDESGSVQAHGVVGADDEIWSLAQAIDFARACVAASPMAA